MTRSLPPLAVCALLAIASPVQGQTDETRLLIRHVAVSQHFVVFSYAGDLWKVARDGGTAERLTAGPADDDFPVITQDGLHVAFSRRGADDWDVYVTDAAGSEPRRLTYNPEADIVRGWNATGDTILFTSHRDAELVFRLYTIPRDGVFPTEVSLPRSWDGELSPAGDRIAYVPFALPGELFGTEWRYYRGGMASPISIVQLQTGVIDFIPREDSNDREPMWIDETLYFVSDRSGTFNIHSYDPETRAVEQLTEYERYGVESASAGGDVIAYVQDGRIHILIPGTRETWTLDVEVDPDLSELQPRTVRGDRFIESGSLSTMGGTVIFGARGEVMSFDPATGSYENVTASSGAVERYPAPSPSGQWIAYFSDESGEYQLQVRPADGEGPVRKIPVELKPRFYRELVWSPDSKRIAFSDSELTLWVADVETLGARRVATSEYSYQDRFQPSWSPDGIWLAYSRYEGNRQRAVHLYHAVRGRKLQVTDGSVNAEHPVFDKSGRYLYFVGSNTAPLGEFGWDVLSAEIYRPFATRRLNVVVLREGFPAPVLPIVGEPDPRADSLAQPPPAAGPPRNRGELRRQPPPARGARPAGQSPQGPGSTVVSVAGLADRTVPLPLPARDYGRLIPKEPGVFYVLVNEWPPSLSTASTPTGSLYLYDVTQPRELKRLIENVDDLAVSYDGSKVLYRRGSEWFIVSGDEPSGPEDGKLDLSSIELQVDPAAEWQQMYGEAWRLIEDYFYDPTYHGQNVLQLADYYGTYLPTITRRRDLNALIAKAVGHISVSHLAVLGGDIPSPPGQPGRVGLLGADYEIDQGLYRITRIHQSGHYNLGNPLQQGPLDQPGVYVQPGDYLLAVDGVRITAQANVYSFFEGKALTPTRITVADNPEGEDGRTYTVVPLPGENTLRRWAWAERNRRAVTEESQGILGYIYVPNFSSRGLEAVFQQLLQNSDKRGLIIDQRFAPGGITADLLIEWLKRSPLYYYTFRHGSDLAVPTNPLPANKVLLINDVNASAAETFAFMFKLANAGRVIGTRTMGAGIGPYVFVPRLLDGGQVIIPNRAAYNPDGSWDIENFGVEPDIEVRGTVADWWEGRDPQLGTAIRTVLQMIIENPPLEVNRPAYPVHR
jgi:tricorn protease